MHYRESEEMYLETILLLTRKNGSVRRVDIAEELGVAKPSVTSAMKSLKTKGFICDDEAGHICLTAEGLIKAEEVLDRHHLLTRLLTHIGAAPEAAEENACRIEHVVSSELMDAIRRYMAGVGGIQPVMGD